MMKDYEDYPAQYREALNLLIPLWKGIPADYKRKYARNIWQQFEENIRSSAYTTSLSRFVNSICLRLQIVTAADDLPAVNAVLNAGGDRALLRQLRDEAATLVLMVRLENDKRKKVWEALAAERAERVDFGLFESGDTAADDDLFEEN